MINRKINFLAQSGLVPESLAFRLACTTEVICRVINGRSYLLIQIDDQVEVNGVPIRSVTFSEPDSESEE